MFKFDVTFSEDLRSATVRFPQEIQASAENFDELIGKFAAIRSQEHGLTSAGSSAPGSAN